MSEKAKRGVRSDSSRVITVILKLFLICAVLTTVNSIYWRSITGEKGLHYFGQAMNVQNATRVPFRTYLPQVNYTPWGISHIHFEAPDSNIENWLTDNFECHELSLGNGTLLWLKTFDIRYFTHGWQCGDNPSFELYVESNEETPTAYIVNIRP